MFLFYLFKPCSTTTEGFPPKIKIPPEKVGEKTCHIRKIIREDICHTWLCQWQVHYDWHDLTSCSDSELTDLAINNLCCCVRVHVPVVHWFPQSASVHRAETMWPGKCSKGGNSEIKTGLQQTACWCLYLKQRAGHSRLRFYAVIWYLRCKFFPGGADTTLWLLAGTSNWTHLCFL